MKSRRHTIIVTGLVTAVLLVPVLIWSGKRSMDASTRGAAVKLPEVSTVGFETKPYELTPLEREKLSLPAQSSPVPFDHLYGVERMVVEGSEGPYPGMTKVEFDKLAEWQARVREGTVQGMPGPDMRRGEPISTIEIVPRAPGVEGLTPGEKAKLEAFRKERE